MSNQTHMKVKLVRGVFIGHKMYGGSPGRGTKGEVNFRAQDENYGQEITVTKNFGRELIAQKKAVSTDDALGVDERGPMTVDSSPSLVSGTAGGPQLQEPSPLIADHGKGKAGEKTAGKAGAT